MKRFNTPQQAISFVRNLDIPKEQIESDESLPQIFINLELRLKWADCDIIRVSSDFEDKPPYKKYWKVEKRWFGGPLSASEVFGMCEPRYKTPSF